jgi:hypothetical protein
MAKEYVDYIEAYKELDEQFMDWKNLFKDVRDYILPRRGKFIDDATDSAQGGEKRHDMIIDGTATKAIRTLAAGMHGGLTSPAMRWFRLVPQDVRMVKPGGSVAEWLETVERLFYAVLARSNFYSTIHTFYEEESGFGTGVILTEEDDEKLVRFRIITAGEYRIDNNEKGLIDTVYRLYYMNSKQMKQKFGYDVLPPTIQEEINNNNPYSWHKILHCVEPNASRDSRKIDNRNMAFNSVYMMYDERDKYPAHLTDPFLSRKGYIENPYAAARWAVIGNEAYGVCPGHDLLGDVKQLQVVTLAKMEAQEKMVRPPMRVPSQYKDVLDTRPDGMNWVDVLDDSAIQPLYAINYDVRCTKEDILDLRQQIKEGFYNDLFMMLAQSTSIQPKTATEIAALQEEKLIMLGPVIERQFHEVHDPILSRLWGIFSRHKLIPPAPPELSGQELKIEYISLLAEAQKRVGVSAVTNTVAFITQLGQVLPAALDKLDVDKTVDIYAELYGAPSGVINSEEGVASIRASRQQQEQALQQQQQVETMATGAKGAKDLAKAPMDENNALTALMGQATGQTTQGV